MSGARKTTNTSPWDSSTTAPLLRPVFRALWASMMVSTLGIWMHEIGAGWLMTTLAPDPATVALIPAATMLPMFLLALPAGALADIVDRRRYLLVALSWLIFTACALAFFSISGLLNAWGLIGLTVLMGIGTLTLMTGFQALVPDLVPRNEMIAAVTLNAIAANLTRIVGPALAGIIVATTSTGWIFAVNAVIYLAVLTVIFFWHHEHTVCTLPSERFFGAIRSGMRFASQSKPLQIVIVRGLPNFILFSSTLALLPLIVRRELGYGPEIFGNLMGCVGLGAVAIGLNLGQIRKSLSSDTLIVIGGAATVMSTLALAYLRDIWVIGGFMVLFGAAWMTVLSTLQINAQLVLPDWVRARGLAIYLASFSGTVAVGSVVWGQLASATSIPIALVVAAVSGAMGIALALPLSLNTNDKLDHSPAFPIPNPILPYVIKEHEGPIMVEIEYQIDPPDVDEFLYFMRTDNRRMRRRNGAITWGLFQEMDVENCFVEVFVEESWAQRLRSRSRLTADDLDLINRARSFHRGSEPPRVSQKISRRSAREFVN